MAKFVSWLKSLRPISKIGLVILIILLLLLILLPSPSSQPSSSTSPPTSPDQPQLETATTPPPLPPDNALPLTLVKINPSGQEFPAANTRNAFYLYLNHSPDLTTAWITSTPSLTFQAKVMPDDPNRLIIIPTSPWQPNQTYFVTIHQGLTSSDGQYFLKNNINKTLTIQDIPYPDYNQPG